MVIGICKGVGDLKGQNFKGKYEAKLEFPGGWGRVLKPKKSSKGGEGVDIILEQHIRHWIQGVVPLKHIYTLWFVFYSAMSHSTWEHHWVPETK